MTRVGTGSGRRPADRGGGGGGAGGGPRPRRSRRRLLMAQESKFQITASGPVGFDCWEGGGFPNCDPMIFKIFGTAPASGTFVGKTATFETTEKATPQPPTYADNEVDGHAVVTRKNGDKLYIHYTGVSPAPNPDETGV